MKTDVQRSNPHYNPRLHVIVDSQGREHSLSPHCAALFAMLLENADHLVTREEIKEAVWGHRYVSDDTINHTMQRLRQKIKSAGGTAIWTIETHPTLGYRLSTASVASPSGLWAICRHWVGQLFNRR